MLLRLACAHPSPSAAARWRPPGRARPAPRFRRGRAAAYSTDGAGAPSSPLQYDPLADLLGPDVGISSSRSQNTAPIAEKGKLRSWVGPNGQYYRELPCPSCRGRGYTPCKQCGVDRSSLDCPTCNGKGISMCLQCGGECVIWQESIDEQPWEKVRSSSPLKVKEDDEVDKLEIKINTPKRSKRTYPSPSPEVAMKISRSLRVIDLRMLIFVPLLLNMKRTKGTAAARKHASETQKAFFSNPENRLKRSIAMKGVKFSCSRCGQEGHRSFYCPTVRKDSARVQFKCRLCGGEGHNSRTCGKPKSEEEQQRQPRHCSRCGEKGHNRRNCPRSTDVDIGPSGYMINKVTAHNSGIYSCSFCLEKGHNRRTCPKRKTSLGK
ncbi:hypothetical protein BAE44_0006319 [Dichanthelium oligosanthes]|uniref:CCHC-type domain-containing protein n=1 Tax=Dichanthelium oligosanthes TaxID=888268 RepID=A0A1E5W5J6_9POAL|nr:hypothetical protein BAE44_0006319 [Dichanthelium oligosanthes]